MPVPALPPYIIEPIWQRFCALLPQRTKRDDLLVGRAGDDRITTLAGNDTLRGGNGRDMLLARDGEKDRLRCGGGRDPYQVDDIDVVSEDCERELDWSVN